jgi:Sulfotransferase family
MTPSSDAAPVFIVGSMRSGTTLLRLMLNEHPDVAIPAESHFLSLLFDRFDPAAQLSGPELEEAAAIVAGSEPWQRDFAHTGGELRVAVGSGPIALAQFITRVFRLEIGPAAARWGDKTPHYLNRVRALVTCFPAAKVIATVRDPRDNYLSLAPRDWVGHTPWDIGRYLARNGRLLQRWRAEYPDTTFTVVRYEDLVLDTDRTLRSLCEFLGIPFDARMETFFRNAEHNVQGWELDIGAHEKLLRAPSSEDVGRWKREGSRVANAEIEALTVDLIDEYGYERRLPAAALPVLRSAARALHHAGRPASLFTKVRSVVRATPKTPR